MKAVDLQIKFISMAPTDAIKSYVVTKVGKLENFLERAVKGEVMLKERVHRRGVDKDFRIDINISLPKSRVVVQEEGEDLYAIIDKAVDVLARRLKRYYDKLSQWEGEKPWKVLEAEEALAKFEDEKEQDDSYVDYVPEIAVHKKIEDTRPKEYAEAIEEMELKGFNQLLFKNKEGKYCMLYKRNDSTYGLVEPAEDLY
jgi:putative sigma-54 modulation protein